MISWNKDQIHWATPPWCPLMHFLNTHQKKIHWDPSLLRSPDGSEKESGCNLLTKLADIEVVPQTMMSLFGRVTQKGLSISRVFVMPFKIGRGILIFLQ